MWNLIVKEWIELKYNKIFLTITALVSIIFIIGTSYIVTKWNSPKETAPVTIGFADMDQSMYSNMLMEYFEQDDNFSQYAMLQEGNPAQLEEWLTSGQIDAYLILPEKFAENLIQIEHVPVKVKISTRDSTTAVILKNVLASYEKYIAAVEMNAVGLYEIMKRSDMSKSLINETNESVSMELVFTALGRDGFFEYIEETRVKSTSFEVYYLFAILSIVVLYIGMIPAMQMQRDQEDKILERIRITRGGVHAYLVSKWIFYTALVSGILIGIYGITCMVTNHILQLSVVLILILSVATSIILSFVVAWICRERRMFLLFGNMSYLLFSILGGTMIPIMYLPTTLYNIGKFTPNYWFIKLMLSVVS